MNDILVFIKLFTKLYALFEFLKVKIFLLETFILLILFLINIFLNNL